MTFTFLLIMAVGLLWLVMSLATGRVHFAGHGGGHVHVGVHGVSHTPGTHLATQSGTAHPGARAAPQPAQHFSLFNPLVLAAFLTWFGAAGAVVSATAGILIWTLLAAAAAGILGAAVIAGFMRYISSHEADSTPTSFDFQGLPARVTLPIPAGHVGEVVLEVRGSRLTFPARSDASRLLGRDSTVYVDHIEHGTAVVVPDVVPDLLDAGG